MIFLGLAIAKSSFAYNENCSGGDPAEYPPIPLSVSPNPVENGGYMVFSFDWDESTKQTYFNRGERSFQIYGYQGAVSPDNQLEPNSFDTIKYIERDSETIKPNFYIKQLGNHQPLQPNTEYVFNFHIFMDAGGASGVGNPDCTLESQPVTVTYRTSSAPDEPPAPLPGTECDPSGIDRFKTCESPNVCAVDEDGGFSCKTPRELEIDSIDPPCDKDSSDFNRSTGSCDSIQTPFGPISTDVGGFIRSLLGLILSVAGGIVVILIIISGYRLMTSSGNPERVQAAREQLTSAIVGLLFIIFSLVILQLITKDILGLPGF